MSKKVVAVLFVSVFLFSMQASAQENEVSFSLGGTFSPGASSSQLFGPAVCPLSNPSCTSFFERFHVNSQIAYEGVYARRILELKAASFYLELPVVGVPSRTLGSSRTTIPGFGSFSSRSNFSSIFVTPSFKTKFLPDAPVSPFLSVGGGFAHFTSQIRSTEGVDEVFIRPTESNDTFAFQFGGGLDFKTPLPHLGFRLEAREFLTGHPEFDFGQGHHLNNVFAGAGVVFHF